MTASLPNCRADAEAFVQALTGSADPANEYICWQVFDDGPDKDEARAQVLNASLNDYWDSFVQFNQQGLGIFVTVNETDNRGRCEENIRRIRSFFVDDDSGLLTYNPATPDAQFRLPPSMVVRSKSGIHIYWILKEPSNDLAAFTPQQLGLAQHFGTDKKVKDLPRVMRVPGLCHMKNPSAPFLVKLEQVCTARYTVDEIQRAFPPAEVEPKELTGPCAPLPDSNNPANEEVFERARRYIAKCPGVKKGENRDETAWRLAAKLTRGFELSDAQTVELLKEWNEKNSPPLPTSSLPAKARNGREYGNEEIGGMLNGGAVPRPRPMDPRLKSSDADLEAAVRALQEVDSSRDEQQSPMQGEEAE